MRIDALASWPHYVDHLTNIWAALPDDLRGTFYAPCDVVQWHPNAGLVEGFPDRNAPGPVLVAGFADHHAIRPRPSILVNHGAGQTYAHTAGPESFSGGPGRERVVLHLEPGPMAARASEAAGYAYAAVGMPLLDPWHRTPAEPEPDRVVVALHHNGRGAPEQGSAWPHYAAAFGDLARTVDVVGHGHPRGWERTRNRWHQLGVKTEARLANVLDTAALLVTDVSSAGAMFASTGRPVIWVSAPWHLAAPRSGGRFFDWVDAVEVAGGHVTDPDALTDAVVGALGNPQRIIVAQQAIVDDVFAACDGRAAERAAQAVTAAVLASTNRTS